MRMIIGITALVLVRGFSAWGDLQALPLENMATVVQMNSCQDCEGVEQQNLAFIFQAINTHNIFTYIPDLVKSNEKFMEKIAHEDTAMVELLMNLNKSQKFLMWCFSVSEDGDLQALSFENMATVVQMNSCQDCEGVEQQNLVFIFQAINTHNVFTYIPDLVKFNEGLMQKIANVASIIQENICTECEIVNQQNRVTIFQEIDIDNFLVNSEIYQEYLDISQDEISNIANVSQVNECVICQNVDQINSVFILQYINSEDLFIPTLEFVAQDSLFMDLVNIAMIIYRGISESDVQDTEGTYGRFERYFVPVQSASRHPLPPTGSVLLAVNAGGSPFTATDGTAYQADTLVSGGETYKTTAAIAGTADDALYQSKRYGNFTYNVPVATGDYVVTLKFAEIYFSAPGRRVFDVLIEGGTVVSNLDVFAQAGQNTAYDVTVAVRVTDGTLTITFRSIVDNAMVSAILIKTP